jgi:hypothetical protein
MRETTDPVFDQALAIPLSTWRKARGGRLAHHAFRLLCLPRPAVWMAQETGLT